jgi:hypothetical protein
LLALLSGEAIFSTLVKARQDFLRLLATGRYVRMTSEKLKSVEIGLGANLDLHWFNAQPTMEKANLAFARAYTPGSWPQEDRVELVLGLDFFPYDVLQRPFASFEAYEACWERRRVLDIPGGTSTP